MITLLFLRVLGRQGDDVIMFRVLLIGCGVRPMFKTSQRIIFGWPPWTFEQPNRWKLD